VAVSAEPEFGFIERFVSDAFAVVEHPMAPGVLGAPVHTHSREDELSYIVYGTVQAQVGDHVITAGPRDVIWKPRGVPHAFWNPGPERALVLELIVPGGFEKYFRELEPLLRGSPDGRPDGSVLAELEARYGLEVDPSSIPVLGERHHVRPPRM
jgi:mannose-6-phosphate isomerase-like protein (cupin superfamily)